MITVGANPVGASLSDVSDAINAKIAKLPLPPGVRITQGGQVKDQATVYGSIFAALGLAVMLMYLILVVQFGSFLDPLAIMMSLPLSLIGVVIALIVTRDTLNIMSLIGVILLMGIVAKNAILLIDFAKWSKEKNGSSTPRRADRGGPDPVAADPDDDAGADRRDDPGGPRIRRRRRLPLPAGTGRDRRRDHVDIPHAAGHPNLLRNP